MMDHKQRLGRVAVIAAIVASIVGLGYFVPKAWGAVTVTMDSSSVLGSPPPGGYCQQEPSIPIQTDGEAITVAMAPVAGFVVGSINSTWWKSPPTTDAVWQLSFRSLVWAQPIAWHAKYNFATDVTLKQVISQVKAFYTQNPDPGTATTTATTNANHWGWDEGTSLRRLTTLNCLYSLSLDKTLIPLMQKEVDVQVCPRYYGPPCNPVHNHAVMANSAIYRAGDLTDNDTWKNTAANRLSSEILSFFDTAGFMKEQSSGYQAFDISMWSDAANLIRPDRPSQAATIDNKLTQARVALRWFTTPAGRQAQIGAGSDDLPGAQFPKNAVLNMIDDTYGWAAGRWSWTDPNTMYYVIKYGPATAFHGTKNRPGITWSDFGEPILVEPGTYGSLTTDPYVAYQTLETSNNVALPSIAQGNKIVSKSAASIATGSAHAYTFKDSASPTRPHSRYYAIYGAGSIQHKLLIRDTFNNDPALSSTNNIIRQWFHLDPTWTLQSQTTNSAVFKSASGRTLTMTTTGVVSSIQKGVTSATAPRGWHFPKRGVKVPATEICIRKGPGSTTTVSETSFVVS